VLLLFAGDGNDLIVAYLSVVGYFCSLKRESAKVPVNICSCVEIQLL